MTETQLKLKDAATQMKLALKNTQSQEVLSSCINSFIPLARSVTSVMQKESSDNKELLNWYENEMNQLKQLPIMKFFHAKRNYTMHQGNVKMNQRTFQAYNIKYSNEDSFSSGQFSVWIFDDIELFLPGNSGNVFRICEEYFLILKQLVHVWLEKKKMYSEF